MTVCLPAASRRLARRLLPIVPHYEASAARFDQLVAEFCKVSAVVVCDADVVVHGGAQPDPAAADDNRFAVADQRRIFLLARRRWLRDQSRSRLCGSERVMLANLSEQIRDCLDHAEECARKAADQTDPGLRNDFLRLEKRWLELARSWEFADRLDRFTKDSPKPKPVCG